MEISTRKKLDRTFVPYSEEIENQDEQTVKKVKNDLDRTFVPYGDEIENQQEQPVKILENGYGLKWWGAMEGAPDNTAMEEVPWMGRGRLENEDEQSQHENVGGCRCGDCESDISTESDREMTQEKWDRLNMTWKKRMRDADISDNVESPQGWDNFNTTWNKRIKIDMIPDLDEMKVVNPLSPLAPSVGAKNVNCLNILMSPNSTQDGKSKVIENLDPENSKSLRNIKKMPTSYDDDNIDFIKNILCSEKKSMKEYNERKPIEPPRSPAPLKVSPSIVLLEKYRRQLGGPLDGGSGADYGETGCRLALIGIKSLLDDEKINMEDVVASGVLNSITRALMRKGREETKVAVMRVLLACWSKAEFNIKNIILEQLGDFVVQRLANEGGDVGWLAALLLEKN